MNKIHYRYCAVLVLLCGVLGCGQNVPFGGRVTFSDDNSPLPVGTVCFEKGTFLARGELTKDGHYDLGSLKLKDGIPKGEYRVCILGATESAAQAPVVQVGGAATVPPKSLVPLIDSKYATIATSGLRVTIDGTTKTFDFQVDRYKPK